MKNIVMVSVISICAILIVVSFFMPWAKVSASATKVGRSLAQSAEGALKDSPFAGKFIKKLDKATEKIAKFGDIEIKTAVSGYDIPTLVNKESSTIALSLVQIFLKDAKGVEKKVLLVYLIPLLALACIGLAILGKTTITAIFAIAVISGAISIVGLFKIMTTDLSKLIVQISIQNGLWQTLYAYLVICIVSVIWGVMAVKEAKQGSAST